MFDELLKAINELKNVEIHVDLPADQDGCLDRRCPAANCGAKFKVMHSDWLSSKVADNRVFCPICRAVAGADEWLTPDQTQYIERTAFSHVDEVIAKAASKDARKFNRQQPDDGFIRMSMSYQRGAVAVVVPPEASERLERRVSCKQCGVRYATLGTGYFCPACGRADVLVEFEHHLAEIRARIEWLSEFYADLAEKRGKDVAENTARSILENALGELVRLFQFYAEALYLRLPMAQLEQPRKNVFQRLPEGSSLWERATGRSYSSILGEECLEELNLFFQKRHIIEHKGGRIDQEYIDKSHDDSYAVGQRIVIGKAEVMRMLDLVELLGRGLRSH